MNKNPVKHKKSSFVTFNLISTFLVAVLFIVLYGGTPAFSSGLIYRLGGENAPSRFDDIKLKNGQWVEMDFKILSEDENHNLPASNGEIMMRVGCQKSHSITLKYLGGRWVTLYIPGGSTSFARKYYNDINIKENGINRLRIERNKDWIFFSVNGVQIAALPGESSIDTVNIYANNMEMEYRIVKSNLSSEKFVEMDIEGGVFHQSNPLYFLNDGDIVRVMFNPLEIHKSRRWANSLVFYVDNTALWMNYYNGKYKFDYVLDDCEDDSDVFPYTLKKGMNHLDIERRGSNVVMFLNGKKIRSYRHRAFHSEPWPVVFKAVGYKIIYGAKKLKGKILKKNQGRTQWSNRKSSQRSGEANENNSGGKLAEGKILDARAPVETKISNVITRINDGETAKVNFKILKYYRRNGASCDVGFDVDDDRVFLRNMNTPRAPTAVTLLDPYNRGQGMQIIKLNKGVNSIEYRRKGKTAKVYLNGQHIRNLTARGNWELRVKVFGTKVKYSVEKK